MYVILQAGILVAQKLLKERLNVAGCHQSQYTPGLWNHEWRTICFTLVFCDFGVKYVGEEYACHLLDVVKQYYVVTDDLGKKPQGNRFIGITLDWDYGKHRIHLSMLWYVPEALVRFKRERPRKLQNQSHKNVPPPGTGKHNSLWRTPRKVFQRRRKKKTYIQQAAGTFVYYALLGYRPDRPTGIGHPWTRRVTNRITKRPR